MQDMLDVLEAIIAERARNPVAGSYTCELLVGGRAMIAQKVGEEAVEVVIAALSQERDQQLNELADLMYHTLGADVRPGHLSRRFASAPPRASSTKRIEPQLAPGHTVRVFTVA